MATSNGSDIFKYATLGYSGPLPGNVFADISQNHPNEPSETYLLQGALSGTLSAGHTTNRYYNASGVSGVVFLTQEEREKKNAEEEQSARTLIDAFNELSEIDAGKVINFLGNVADIAGLFMHSAQNQKPPAFLAGSPLAAFFNPQNPIVFTQAAPDPYGFNASTALSTRIPLERPLTLASAPIIREPGALAPQNA